MIGRLHTARPVRNARLSRDGARSHMKSWMLSARRFLGSPSRPFTIVVAAPVWFGAKFDAPEDRRNQR